MGISVTLSQFVCLLVFIETFAQLFKSILSDMHMKILSRFKNAYEVNMKIWKRSGNYFQKKNTVGVVLVSIKLQVYRNVHFWYAKMS